MASNKQFRKQFWQNKSMVGAMAPSSRFLCKKMLQSINFNDARVLIELGPGTGVFTKEIIKKLHPEAKLLVFELNDLFFENLREHINDPRVVLIHDSAEHLEKYLVENNLGSADVVISSLPLAVFSQELRENILNASLGNLKPAGKYVQFQYSLQAKNLLKKTFRSVEIDFTPFNFPPAFVYTCQK